MNQGATCYANAVIQALLSFDFLREPLSRTLFLHSSNPETRRTRLCEYLEAIMTGEDEDGKKTFKFEPNIQQDAHEFMFAFLGDDALHLLGECELSDQLKLFRFDKHTMNIKIVDGKVEESTCAKTSEFFFRVQASERIEDALAKLSEEESIKDTEKENKLYTCLSNVKYFIVQADIFDFNRYGGSSIKLGRNVEPEPNLIIPELVGNRLQKRSLALNAIVLHEGESTNSGHYIALVRYGKDWYLANDSSVTVLGALPRSVKGFTPYLYFYQEGEYPDGIQLKGDLASLSDAAGGSNCNYLKSRSSKDAVFSGLKTSPSTMSVTSQGPRSGSFQQSGKNFSVPYQVMELLMSQKRK